MTLKEQFQKETGNDPAEARYMSDYINWLEDKIEPGRKDGIMTEKQIKELRPRFKYGLMIMVEWFEITKGFKFCTIKSGLNHADNTTKSPYYFQEVAIGDNAENEVFEKFTKWWDSLNHEELYEQYGYEK